MPADLGGGKKQDYLVITHLSRPSRLRKPPRGSVLVSFAGQFLVALDSRCGHRGETIATLCDSRVIAAFLDVWKPLQFFLARGLL